MVDPSWWVGVAHYSVRSTFVYVFSLEKEVFENKQCPKPWSSTGPMLIASVKVRNRAGILYSFPGSRPRAGAGLPVASPERLRLRV